MPASPNSREMAQRIARALPSLTPSHRRMADFVLANPLKVATMPVDELAAQVGISIATVNRFARALHFDGYSQFRAALVRDFEGALGPVERLRSQLDHPSAPADVFDAVLARAQQNIDETRQDLDPRACAAAVQMIHRAERIFLVGYGVASWLCGLLQHKLERSCDHVKLLSSIEGASHAARLLGQLKPTDLVIALSFPRYLADTVLLARATRRAKAPLLVLTDRVTAPIVPLADVVLYMQSTSEYFANSEACTVAMIEALASAVSHVAEGTLNAATRHVELAMPWSYDDSAGWVRAANTEPGDKEPWQTAPDPASEPTSEP